MPALNILVVEDEFLVAADIEESLISLGYKVQNTVASGPAAIAEVEKNLPDLILMDIILKGEMTGIEAATVIGEKHNVPIIYLTANADFATVEKAKISLPYGYILKPFTEKELQTNIEIARFKFENDLKSRIESDQFNKFFRLNEEKEELLMVDSDKGLEKIHLPDVYYIEQSGENCKAHMRGDNVLIRSTLDEIASHFPADKFVRVSRDHLVNIDKIFIAKFPEIIIADKMSVIIVEKEYKEAFESKMNS
jgi:DNA-binding LytR/AlgR family response regulator